MVAVLVFCAPFVSAQGVPGDGAEQEQEQEEEVFTLDSPAEPSESKDSANGITVWDRLNRNRRLNLDAISHFWTTRRRGKASARHAVALDLHKVFTDDEGDIGTMLLQISLSRYDNALPAPHHAEDDDDWEIEFHDFWFNLTRWGKGRTNVRIGRFDVPYGLELLVDTHFTLYQVINHENLGVKKDWGISLNGTLPSFDYEVALTQASGHEYWNVGKNYAVAARIGTPSHENLILGVSGFYGQVIDEHGLHRWRDGLKPPSRVDRVLGRSPGRGRGDDNLVRRLRVGVDATWVIRQFTLRADASVGRDFNQDVFNSLVELDWTSADERFRAYIQGIYFGQRFARGWDADIIGRLGAVWEFADGFDVSAEYSQDFKVVGDGREDAVFAVQFRWRL